MSLKRRVGPCGAPVGDVAAIDQGLTSLAPTLAEFLTLLKWEDGSKRQTGTVMLFAEDGVWKAWLNDRDGGVSAWVSGGTLMDLLTSIEEGLSGEGLNWRQAKPRSRK